MERNENLALLREKLNEYIPKISDGTVKIIVQDSRVVQIEKSEEIPIKK